MRLVSHLTLAVSIAICSAQTQSVDRACSSNLENLWLDVVVVVDNSVGMTHEGLVEVAAQIVTVFGAGTRIGTKYTSDPRTTRVGVVTYNKEATIQADLDRFQTADDLFNSVFEILSTPSSSADVYLNKGLAAAEKVLAKGRKNNVRINYKQFVIVYASDYRDDGVEDARPVAERMRSSGIDIATVAYDEDGDESLMSSLGEIASPGFNFTSINPDVTEATQKALIQSNCFCPEAWTQYRHSFNDESSEKFSVCLKAVSIISAWMPAKMACQNMAKEGHLVAEFDQKKHDFVFNLTRNDPNFLEPYTYHIGLSYTNGAFYWQQPLGTPLKPLTDGIWNPGFPKPSSTDAAVLNQQKDSRYTVGWQNVNPYTVAERYVCEVAACDADNYCM